jgi:hypothetical protein
MNECMCTSAPPYTFKACTGTLHFLCHYSQLHVYDMIYQVFLIYDQTLFRFCFNSIRCLRLPPKTGDVTSSRSPRARISLKPQYKDPEQRKLFC